MIDTLIESYSVRRYLITNNTQLKFLSLIGVILIERKR
jgi:hypothetical protein